ncbi:hypothetical protein [Marinifilum fragile]|uniref:hypothetical protein n=1 Tax=Marinifilum fragile TaxID=570161 RepID=UPI002AABD16C|nr:hypothetical protein [Marinifilum fragile]
MNNLIYYPSFEFRDRDWLKFALLYLRNVHMIIPERGERNLTREFHDIYESTNLFRIYRPRYDHGYNASLDAIEAIEPILRNPQYYSRRFYMRYGHETILDKWRNQQNQDFEVFEEKYSHEFVHFCIKNRLAHHSPNGLFLPKELSQIYMALLAKAIGDSEPNGLSPITDIGKLDYITNTLRRPDPNEDRITLARNVINVFLPKNLNRLSVEEILDFRTSNNFDAKLTAFHNAINGFHSSVENGNLAADFIRQYENPFNELTEELKNLSLELVTYGLGTYMILNAPNIEIPNVIKDVIIGGVTIYTGRKIRIKSTWNNTRSRVLTRRYLTGIKQIRPATSIHKTLPG